MTLELVPWRGSSVPVLNGQSNGVARSFVGIDQYAAWLNQFGGSFFSPPPPTTLYGQRPAEPISYSFQGFVEGMLYADGPVAAVEAYRLRVFSQAPLLYQDIVDGRAGKFADDERLDALREPWPGGTMGDLMKRSLVYGDFAGNAFILDIEDELVVVRPDWVQIVLEKRVFRGGQVGWRQQGILYFEGGLNHGDGVAFLPGEYAHFIPGLPDPLAVFRGMSWLTPLIREVKADKAAGDHKVAFWENAAMPNVAVSLPKEITPEQFRKFVDEMDAQHKGPLNSGKTLYTAGGADVTVIGSNMVQADFSSIIGKGETRIASAGGVPPVLLSFSEGMQGSSLNAGNYQSAKRNFVDTTMRDLWANWCGSLAQMDRFRPESRTRRLWYDGRDIPFLHEDAKDLADIQSVQATAINQHITAGFEPSSARDAVAKDDLELLVPTGMVSVQLAPPGQGMGGTGGGSQDSAPPPDTGGGDGSQFGDGTGGGTDNGAARAWNRLADVLERAYGLAPGIDAVERRNPYPGQQYKHGWIPVASDTIVHKTLKLGDQHIGVSVHPDQSRTLHFPGGRSVRLSRDELSGERDRHHLRSVAFKAVDWQPGQGDALTRMHGRVPEPPRQELVLGVKKVAEPPDVHPHDPGEDTWDLMPVSLHLPTGPDTSFHELMNSAPVATMRQRDLVTLSELDIPASRVDLGSGQLVDVFRDGGKFTIRPAGTDGLTLDSRGTKALYGAINDLWDEEGRDPRPDTTTVERIVQTKAGKVAIRMAGEGTRTQISGLGLSLNLDEQHLFDFMSALGDLVDSAGASRSGPVGEYDAIRGHPHPGQRFRHGWTPVVADPIAEVLTPDEAARDYGDELDRVDVGDASVVARDQGTLTVQTDAEGKAIIHAAPSPSQAHDWAAYIDDGLHLDAGEHTEDHGLIVARTDGGMLLRWPEGDETTAPEEMDGVDLTDAQVPLFTQALRDMGYETEDHLAHGGEEQGETQPDDEAGEPTAARAFDPAKHPHYGKGVAEGKGGEFRPLSALVGDALTSWLHAGGHDEDPLHGYTQPQLRKAAEQLGLNPPKGMRLVPLKRLIEAHARGGGKFDVPNASKPSAYERRLAARAGEERRLGREFNEELDSGLHWSTNAGQGARFDAHSSYMSGQPPWVIADKLRHEADRLEQRGRNSELRDHDITGVLRHDQASRDQMAIRDAERLRSLADKIEAKAGNRPSPEELAGLTAAHRNDRIARIKDRLRNEPDNPNRAYMQDMLATLQEEDKQARVAAKPATKGTAKAFPVATEGKTESLGTAVWTDPQTGKTHKGVIVKQNTASAYVRWDNGRTERVPLNDTHGVQLSTKPERAARKAAATTPASPTSDVDRMTVPQLRAHAKANGIPLHGATKKADMLAAIKGGGSDAATGPAKPDVPAPAAKAKDWRDAVPTTKTHGVDVSFPPEKSPRLLPDKARQAQVEADARQAILAARGHDWVRLPAVRDALQAKGYSREEQDAALLGLATQPDVRIVPIANLKSLSADDRKAAVFLGGEHKTAIMIERPGSAPSASSATPAVPAAVTHRAYAHELTPDDAFIWKAPDGTSHEVQIRSGRIRNTTMPDGSPGLEMDVEGTGNDRGFPATTVRLGLNDEVQRVDKRATASTGTVAAPQAGRTPKRVMSELDKAKQQLDAAEAKSREERRMQQSDREIELRNKVQKPEAELRQLGYSPITRQPVQRVGKQATAAVPETATAEGANENATLDTITKAVAGLHSPAEIELRIKGLNLGEPLLRRLAHDMGVIVPSDIQSQEALERLIAGHLARTAGFRRVTRSQTVDDPDMSDEEPGEADETEDVDEASRGVLGHDVTPGHDELHHYWTLTPEGRARWVESPKPWTTLLANLQEEVHDKPIEVLKKWASRWFIEVFGYAAGSDMNRVTHGQKPRGKIVGPG